MRNRHLVAFQRIPVGAEFTQNGNYCRKRSRRTAEMIAFDRWFYWGMRELCEVSTDVRNIIVAREAD